MLKSILNKSSDRAIVILAPLIRRLIIRAIRKAEQKGFTFGYDLNEEKIANFIADWILTGGSDRVKVTKLMDTLQKLH